MKLNARAFIEVDLSDRPIVSESQVYKGDFYIGVELSDGSRLYTTIVSGEGGKIAYILNDPENMTQYGDAAYGSFEDLFKEFPKSTTNKVKSWFAFEESAYLLRWALNDSVPFSYKVTFGSEKVSSDSVEDSHVVALKINADAFHIVRASGGFSLISVKTNSVYGTYQTPLKEVLREIKKVHGNVQAYICENPVMMYEMLKSWTIEGGVYALA